MKNKTAQKLAAAFYSTLTELKLTAADGAELIVGKSSPRQVRAAHRYHKESIVQMFRPMPEPTPEELERLISSIPLQLGKASWRQVFKQAAKDSPRAQGGRRRKIQPADETRVIQELRGLRQDFDPAVASKRVAGRWNVSPRTISRIWQKHCRQKG